MSPDWRTLRSNYLFRVLGIISALLVLHGCGGSSSGGEQIVTALAAESPAQCRTFVVDKDHTEAADTNDGRYRVDGGNGPWKTIQHAIDNAQPCDTVRVRASMTPYSEGQTTGGIVITNSGEKNRHITLEGFPSERPVIDQQQNSFGSALTAGFILQCSNEITLRNFEIRNVGGAGISTALTGCISRDITLENLHIHTVYGGNLVAGIRLAGIKNVALRNNRIHDVIQINNDETSFANAGIIENIVIENNIVANTERAITIAQQSLSPPTTALIISNNTLANTNETTIALENAHDVRLFNNIVTSTTGSLVNITGDTQIALLDYNLYWSDRAAEWTVEKNSVIRNFIHFAEWQTAYSLEQLTPFITDPDQHSRFDNPLFLNGSDNDFQLSPNSPAHNAGIGGKSMGAHFDEEKGYSH